MLTGNGLRVCIFGSRSLSGDAIREIINRECQHLKCVEIVTAEEPHGVCEEARRYAKDNGLKLTAIPKQTHKLSGMFHHRSVMCYESSDFVLLIHDGLSAGTQNEFELALKMGMPLTYHCIQTKKEPNTTESLNFTGFKI